MATKTIDQVSFDFRTDPPVVKVAFSTQDAPEARKVSGVTEIHDEAAAALVVPGLMDAILKAIDAQAAGVVEPGSVAARITAAAEAEARAKIARAALRTMEQKNIELDKAIKAKEAQLNGLTAQVAAAPPAPTVRDPNKTK